MKFEKARIFFFSEVFVAVAVILAVTDLSSLLTSIRHAVRIGLACSQIFYFLFKSVDRA